MTDEFIIGGILILAILFGGDPDLMDAIITTLTIIHHSTKHKTGSNAGICTFGEVKWMK